MMSHDVFRRVPVNRTVVECNGNEREQIAPMLPSVPPHSVCMFDRGYPSYETINFLKNNYNGFFLFRAPASQSFSVVQKFIKSKKDQDIIWITPSYEVKRKLSLTGQRHLKSIKLRIIRLESPEGKLSVLLTNLFGKNKYTANEIRQLYFRRWEIENYYRDEKITMELEKFHSKTINGIMQEFYATMIMSVIARTLMALSSDWYYSGQFEPQFKNAILTLSADAPWLSAQDRQKALIILIEISSGIARVKYYRPKTPRTSQPRVNKGPRNRWRIKKTKKLLVDA